VASSISNSNDRISRHSHARTWLAALAATTGIILFLESLARLTGYQGMPENDAGLWSLARTQLKENDPSQVVFIGSSRMQLGMDPVSFSERFGTGKAIQLAVIGSSPVPVLTYLAGVETFKGIVVCELLPPAVFRIDQESSRTLPSEYIQTYENRSWTLLPERFLKLEVESTFACMNSRFRPLKVMQNWINKGQPLPPSIIVRPDRCLEVDYEHMDPRKKEFRTDPDRAPVPRRPDQLQDCLKEIEDAVSKIQGRGGEVVFVRFPVGGGYLEMEERLFPRAQYWDELARTTKALAIHFDDYPSLAGFIPAEGSHLDYRDAKLFSKALAGILLDKLPQVASSHASEKPI
jgi:hypothetical protein